MKTAKRILKFIFLNIILPGLVLAQAGQISGRIIDARTGEALLGANVVIEGNGIGAASDLDGYYTIFNVPAGAYNLMVSYIGYESQRISNVTVNGDQLSRLDFSLTVTSLEMGSVVVEVDAARSSDSYLLIEQKKSTNVQDGIGAAQMAKSGDSNAAEAARRISGVTIMDGKYVYVRGLGDRYTTTEMNGSPIPSPEPEKRTVPLNLFPTALLESVTALKTYTPDLPGAFGGATVNIRTKAYPDKRTLKVSLAASENQYPRKDQVYLGTGGGNNDYWGFDDGSRKLPDLIPENQKLSEWNLALNSDPVRRKKLLGDIGRAFDTDYSMSREQAGRPVSYGLSYGNRYNPIDNFEWGFYANTTFSNNYQFTHSGIHKYSMMTAGLDTVISLNNNSSEYNTNLGATFSTGIKLFDRHKISLYYIYTHNSQDRVDQSRGYAFQFDDGFFIKQYYVEKSISNLTLSGSHQFDFIVEHRLDWNWVNGISRLDQPDFKGLNYRVKTQQNGEEMVEYYQLDTYSWSAGTRDFTKGFDTNGNFDLNYQATAKDRFGDPYKLKLGLRSQEKTREFSRRSFYNKYGTAWGGSSIPSDITVVDAQNDFGATLVKGNYFDVDADGNVIPGLIMVENTQPSDAYESTENMNAAYAMVDIPLSFGILPQLRDIHFIGGLRREDYRVRLNPYHPISGAPFVSTITGDTVRADINELDFLPSYNLWFQLPHEINVRLSHSKTVARAEFREIAPFEFQAFYGDDIVVGYPWLKTTDISNYDLRVEWFRSGGEVLAVSFFKKDFTNPIEAALIEASGKVYKTFQNAESAKSRGIELDSRTKLNFIPNRFGLATFLLNFTWTNSEVSVDSLVTIFTGYAVENEATSMKRPLQGQSDFIINVALDYNNLKGFIASVSYNSFSRRLVSLGVASIPDEYEMPFHSLNFTASRQFGHLKTSVKFKNILNSKVEIGQDDPVTGQFKTTEVYKPGLSMSLGLSYEL